MQEIVVAQSGKSAQKMTLTEANRRLSAGELALTDSAWSEGMKGWCPLSEFPGIEAGPAREARRNFKPSGKTDEGPRGQTAADDWDTGRKPAPNDGDMWSVGKERRTGAALMPVGIICLASLALGPAWGAWMIASNWMALEQYGKLAGAYLWLALGGGIWVGTIITAILSPSFPNPVVIGGLHLGVYFLWLFASALPHGSYLRGYGRPVTQRSVVIPLVAGFFVVTLMSLALFALAVGKTNARSSHTVAEVVAPSSVTQPAIELEKKNTVTSFGATSPTVSKPNPTPNPVPDSVASGSDARTGCRINLRQLRLACQFYADQQNLAADSPLQNLEVVARYMPDGKLPVCPSGGSYSCTKLGEGADCSQHGKGN